MLGRLPIAVACIDRAYACGGMWQGVFDASQTDSLAQLCTLPIHLQFKPAQTDGPDPLSTAGIASRPRRRPQPRIPLSERVEMEPLCRSEIAGLRSEYWAFSASEG